MTDILLLIISDHFNHNFIIPFFLLPDVYGKGTRIEAPNQIFMTVEHEYYLNFFVIFRLNLMTNQIVITH